MNEKLQLLNDIADEIGGEVRTDYSGRGMFGERCCGIICDSHQRCIEEAAARGLRHSRTDSTGKQFIVYWEGVKADA